MSESKPETPPVAPPRPRRRGVYFWLKMCLAALLLLPLLGYLGLLLFVGLGGLNAKISGAVKNIFNAPVDVGSVSSSWLTNLRVENLAVEGSDKSKALSLGAATLNWDTGPLIREGRIRSLTIEQPSLNLRRTETGEWNLRLKPPSGKGGIRIEQIVFREGDLALEWGAAPYISRMRLQALSGTLSDQGSAYPNAFSLYGVFDSLESIAVSGSAGPGAAWTAHVFGGLNIERDLAGVIGPPTATSLRGHLKYDLSGRQESLLLDTKRGGPIAFSGTLGVDRFSYPISANYALSLPDRAIELHGIARPEGDAANAAIIDELHLTSPGLGALEGGIRMSAKPSTRIYFEKFNGALDLEALRALFQPLPLGNSLDLKGELNISNLAAALPLAPDAPLSADLSINGARVSYSGLGALPLCDIKGTLKWPELDNVALKLGDVAAANLTLKNVYPEGNSKLLALAGDVKVRELRVDIERFWESEIGRRVLTANFDEKKIVSAAADLPYAVKGLLLGENLDVKVSEISAEPAVKRVELSGLKVQNASIARWPFKMNVPMRKVSGDFAIGVELEEGAARVVKVRGKLAGVALKGAVAPSVEFEQSFLPLSKGKDKIGPIRISRLVLPFEDLEQIVGIKALTGISSADSIEITDAVFDMSTGDLRGKLSLKNAALSLDISPGMQAMMVEAMKMTKLSFAAGLLEKLVNGIGLSSLNCTLDIEVVNKRLKLSGKTGRIATAIKLPLDREYKLDQTIPDTAFSFETDLGSPAGGRAATLNLLVAALHKLEARFSETIPSPAGDLNGTWTVSATFATPEAGGISAVLNAPIDLAGQQVGASMVTIKELNLGQAGPLLGFSKTHTLNGRIQNLKLALEPFAMSAASKAANGRLTADLSGAGFSSPTLELAQLTGPIVCVLSSSAGGVGINTFVKLDNYEALVNDGALYIPPPAMGRTGAVRLIGKYSGSENAIFNLNMLQLDLGEEVQIEAAGAVHLQNGTVTKADLETVRLSVPDMARAVQTFGPPNLANRAPWFGDIGLAGTGKFEGRLFWEPTRSAVDGKLGFKKGTFTIGKTTPLAISGVNGELPVMLRQGSWPREKGLELHGNVKLGPLQYSVIRCGEQDLHLVAKPNSLSIETPIEMLTPAGSAKVGSISLNNLLAGSAPPELDFTLSANINAGEMLRNAGISIGGMEDCILSGPPIAAKLKQTSGIRGPWELATSGSIKSPFFGGEFSVERLNARGLLGPAPVFGCDLMLKGAEGIKITQLTERIAEKYPQFGKFSLRANAEIRNFETTAPSFDGIQRFVLDLYSVDFKENEFWYDGRFAMFVNRPLVRAAFPALLFSDEDIKKLTFGVRKLALQYELRDGFLIGPRPTTLPDGLIIQAYGTGGGVKALFADRLKQDIKGHADYKTAWSEIVRALKGGDAK